MGWRSVAFILVQALCFTFAAGHDRKLLKEYGQYDNLLSAIKLYMELKGLLNPETDIDQPGMKHGRPDCKISMHPDGCVTQLALCNFINGRWIPGYEAANDPIYVLPGHHCRCSTRATHAQYKRGEQGQVQNHDVLVDDFKLWLYSRPSQAVPELVRNILAKPGSGTWPGDLNPRSNYQEKPCEPTLIPKKKTKAGGPRYNTCPPQKDDAMFDVPFVLDTTNAVAVKTMVAHGQAIREYGELHIDLRDEEGELSRSHGFKVVFYFAMALMGLMVPVSVLYLFLRANSSGAPMADATGAPPPAVSAPRPSAPEAPMGISRETIMGNGNLTCRDRIGDPTLTRPRSDVDDGCDHDQSGNHFPLSFPGHSREAPSSSAVALHAVLLVCWGLPFARGYCEAFVPGASSAHLAFDCANVSELQAAV